MQSPVGDGEEDKPILFVVDDDQATLDLLTDVAAEAGWAARGFRRLRDLRSSIRRRTPTLVILDDDLPDGSGGDLARELRSDPETTELPLVVCTGAESRRCAEIRSWAPVLAKPFQVEEVERFLSAAWHRRRRAARQQRTG